MFWVFRVPILCISGSQKNSPEFPGTASVIFGDPNLIPRDFPGTPDQQIRYDFVPKLFPRNSPGADIFSPHPPNYFPGISPGVRISVMGTFPPPKYFPGMPREETRGDGGWI